VIDDRHPYGVEAWRGGRGASPGDPVGLLDERHAHPTGKPGLGRCDQVRRLDASAGPVTEDERGAGVVGPVQMDARWTVRSLDLEGRHSKILAACTMASHEGGAFSASKAGA
jgi:hypothetical protein